MIRVITLLPRRLAFNIYGIFFYTGAVGHYTFSEMPWLMIAESQSQIASRCLSKVHLL